MLSALLSGIFMSACYHLYFDSKKMAGYCYFFKPLTTGLIIILAFYQSQFFKDYHYLIIAGLAFSLLGDVFLMLKEAHFLKGLISFFIAHLFYIFAFLQPYGIEINYYLMAFLVIYALLFLQQVMPKAASLKWPIFAYAMILLLMVITSYSFFQVTAQPYGILAFNGAILFMISDTLLAYDKFVGPIKRAQIGILGTYYLAQTLIALSLTN